MKFVPSKSSLYVVLITTAILVLSDSLDALMRGKDSTLFARFEAVNQGLGVADYVALVAISLLAGVLVPVTYALYQTLSLRFSGQSKLSRWMWGVLLLGAFVLRALAFDLSSIFFLLSLAASGGLVIHHFIMKPQANGERSE